MNEQIEQVNHDEMGCNGWEISAHANSAPDHEPIQGKQYSDVEYTALNNSLVRRIGTLNCGHVAFPIILGINSPQYSDAELTDLRRQNEEGITYQGKHYTGYEATQMQRKIERSIRLQKNRILVDKATGDTDKRTIDQIKLRQLNEEYRRFSQAAGLRTESERTWIVETEKRRSRKSDTSEKRIEKADCPAILNERDIYVIDQYKSAKSYQINAALRGEMALSEDIESMIRSIDDTLEKLPVYKGIVYRSMRSEEMLESDVFFKLHIPGNIIKYPAYTSASTEVYDESMDIQLVIQSKQGRDMRAYNPLEQEILFKRGSRFLVEKREGKRIWLKEI